MEHEFFFELLVILTTSVAAVTLLHRLQLPPILGYLATGLLIGPGGLGLIHDEGAISGIAEFGVVFLLFTLGLEFSLPRMLAMRTLVFGMGSAQVLSCTAVFLLLGLLCGLAAPAAFVVAAALALSSTALVGRELNVRGELHTRYGQLAIGILLFQDLAAVLFLILIPALGAGADENLLGSLARSLGSGLLLLVVLLALGKWVLPRLFEEVARSRSGELFALTALMVALLAAAVTQEMGLSMALGAFITGMMLGESHYRHQIDADIRPYRDLLLGIFFVSVGMLLDLSVLAQAWYWILAIALAVMVINFALVVLLGRLFREALEDSARAALMLSQAGEFGFALLALALSLGLVSPSMNAIVIAAIVLTMVVTPWLVRHNRTLVRLLLSQARMSTAPDSASEDPALTDLAGHVIICGFGRVGQSVARILVRQGIPYLAIDSDPRRVEEAKGAGEPVHYGDAAKPAFLQSLGIEHARMVLVSFSDQSVALDIIATTRTLAGDLPILVRTRDDRDFESLLAAGATDVVPETFEASLTLASHTLSSLGVPAQRIDAAIQSVRDEQYALLQGFYHGKGSKVVDAKGRELTMRHPVHLPPQAWAVGKTVRELALGEQRISLESLADEQGVARLLDDDTILDPGDVMVLKGTSHDIESAEEKLLSG